MKTSKLLMIVTVFAIGMLSFTTSLDTEANPGTRAIHLTLEEAVANPNIVQGLYDQLNSTFLGPHDGMYTVTILYQGITVYVTGSYTEWVSFFQMRKLFSMHMIQS
jgi:hypothetical protein